MYKEIFDVVERLEMHQSSTMTLPTESLTSYIIEIIEQAKVE